MGASCTASGRKSRRRTWRSGTRREPRDEGRQRPKQYFAEQSQPQYQQAQYQQAQYQQPQYQQPQYQQPHSEQPYYEPSYQEPEQRSNIGTILLGILAAVSFVAAVSLFFLWRGAAAEADKPPVTETQTVTTTETQTTFQTTTKFPSIFGERDNPTAMLPPEEPMPVPEVPREFREDARDILDQLRDGADQFFQEQQ